MTTYTVGFLFSPNHEFVVLIRKAKPLWQKGKLNGVGGRVEDAEKPAVAMAREFMEEARWDISSADWQLFLRLDYLDSDVRLFFYVAYADPECFPMLGLPDEREPVAWYRTADVLSDPNLIPNLRWIIPMAMSGDKTRAEI